MAPVWSCRFTFPAALAVVTCTSVNGTSTAAAVAPNPAPTVFFFVSAPFIRAGFVAGTTSSRAAVLSECYRTARVRRPLRSHRLRQLRHEPVSVHLDEEL